MKRTTLGLIILAIIIIYGVSQIRSCSDNSSSSSNSYNLGYKSGYDRAKQEFQNSGYDAGYVQAKQEFQNSGYDVGYEDARKEYQRRINNLAKYYDIMVKDEYKKGFTDGEVSMREQITTKIELDAKNKARQGNWNAILFDFKD